MSKQIIPKVSIVNGKSITTSLQIAEYFKKQHYDVLKAIRKLDCSKEFADGNFAGCSYSDGNKRLRPMFNITKDGFVFVVMGFIGKKAALLKEKYIQKFNEMDEQIQLLGLMTDFESKGKLPNDLRKTCEMYALAENSIEKGQKHLRKLRRFRKRCGQHIIDLSTLPAPNTADFSQASPATV
ncbi:MAG: Rha family transcriptional regulator [Deltaproteobacteria bacterium]|nr:Rha family transcriptional regulator [Deltaproteobacteria bacterium]